MSDAGSGNPGIDAVVSHHLNGFRSGVARFNELLAQHLGVPLRSLTDEALAQASHPLLSFKVSELGEAEAAVRRAFATDRARGTWDVFLHEYRGLPLERELVAGAGRVWCGNDEIVAGLATDRADARRLWAPGLVLDDRPFEPSAISVFSFGMAHKLRIDMFEKLKVLLDRTGKSYAVHISTANHETSTMEDEQVVFERMHEVFPRALYFLGNLSDVAVYNHLVHTTFFAAFFRGGARANNTSIASAMEHGAVVITNLDQYSPEYLVHMDNVIDINACEALPDDQVVLKRLSLRAMETAREYSWDRLVSSLREA